MDDNDSTSVGFFKEPGAKGANVLSDTMVYGYKKGWLFIRKRKQNIIKKISKKFCFKFIPFLRSRVRS
jgi:hypothetical protein